MHLLLYVVEHLLRYTRMQRYLHAVCIHLGIFCGITACGRASFAVHSHRSFLFAVQPHAAMLSILRSSAYKALQVFGHPHALQVRSHLELTFWKGIAVYAQTHICLIAHAQTQRR